MVVVAMYIHGCYDILKVAMGVVKVKNPSRLNYEVSVVSCGEFMVFFLLFYFPRNS